MFMKLNKIALAAALGLATVASTSLSVNSMPMTSGEKSASDDSILSVQYNSNQQMSGHRNWSRMHDGNRCRVAYGNCRHYYRGYYYETPWWTFPLIIGGAIASQDRYGRSHREWCFAHHRSYNPHTNKYVGRDGKWHICR